MYVNKCIKCGAEFETKNPKRVICPNCLYADKGTESTEEKPMQSYSSYSSYSTESRPRSYDRPQQGGYRNNYASARPQQGQRRPMQNRRPQKPARPLLISKEQLEQIEVLYKYIA